MEIVVFGTGYVGLVTGACLAHAGHAVTGVDIDAEKVATLSRGECPIHEPDLPRLVGEALDEGRLRFSTDPGAAEACDVVLLALPTPPRPDGSCDTSALFAVVEDIAPRLREGTVVMVRSTVTPGTTDEVQRILDARCPHPVHAANSPEFLREGTAVRDFQVPHRVVIGVRRDAARDVARRLFTAFVDDERPLLVMDPVSAELCKYAANTYLAMRIAYINEIAALTEVLGADIDAVRRALGSDPRIGGRYLYPGPGFGGACFPKDVPALVRVGQDAGRPARLAEATVQANLEQRQRVVDRVLEALSGDRPRLGIWGLAFKAHTSDCRESIALDVIRAAAARGAEIHAYDPEADATDVGPLAASVARFGDGPLDVAEDVDVLAVLTEWPAFGSQSLQRVARAMRGKHLVDARNVFSPREATEAGLDYRGVGHRPGR